MKTLAAERSTHWLPGHRLAARVVLLGALTISANVSATFIGIDMPPADPAVTGARSLLEEGKIGEARAMLQQRLKQDATDVEALLLLGNIDLRERPVAARRAAMSVLEAGGRIDKALDLLTSAYGVTRSAGLLQADEIRLRELEITDYAKLLERFPDWRELLFRSAAQRLDLQRLLTDDDGKRRQAQLSGAVAEFTHLVSLLDAEHSAAVERASALFQLGRSLKLAADFLARDANAADRRKLFYERADQALDRAFVVDPDRVDAVAELARVELARADLDAAINAIGSRIDQASSARGRARLHALLGNLYLQNKSTDKALGAFESALELDKQLLDAYVGLYRLHSQIGEPQRAVSAMESALRVAPRFVLAHMKLGESSAGRSEYADAIKHFEAALAIPLRSAVVLGMAPSRNAYRNGLYYQAAAWLAWLYLEHANDPNRALAAIERAAQFQPLDAQLADTEGWIHFVLGDHERARKLLEAAASKSQDSPAVHYHLARTYAALGNRPAAARSVQQALSSREPFNDLDAAQTLARELGLDVKR